MQQLVNSLHSDRTAFQISVVHGAPGTSVQFISYYEGSRLVGEDERSRFPSHVFGTWPVRRLHQVHIRRGGYITFRDSYGQYPHDKMSAECMSTSGVGKS